MRELIACWQNTRMLVLIAFCAALYVAVLLPFKIVSIVPGITEVRPGAALPVVFSVLFGPAAAWGAAFGNVIGDFLGGTISPGSFFGFFGNLLYGYAPYRILRNYLEEKDPLFSVTGLSVLIFSILIASGLCATIISLGVDAFKIVEFSFLEHTILLNNILVCAVLVPLLLKLLKNRVTLMRLTYTQILEPSEISKPIAGMAGPIIVAALLVVVYLIMMIPGAFNSIPWASQHPMSFKIVICGLLTVLPLILL